MDIKFKEKTFEKYFGHELARLTKITYSPDQCDEKILGYDEAFFLPTQWLFLIAPYIRRRRHLRHDGIKQTDFTHIEKELLQVLPPFKFNLFVQFKRPSYLISPGAKQWKDWQQSYYRYRITQHQQEALEEIDKQSYGRAATVYASPAFWSTEDLWVYVSNSSVVENSNIASVGRLKGHGHYSYLSAGSAGKGHSETMDIKSDLLSQIIDTGLEENKPLPLDQHLMKAATTILGAMDNSDHAMSVFHQVRSALELEGVHPDSMEGALAIIETFTEAFDLRYYAIG